MVMMMRCDYIKEDGDQCKVAAKKGTERCFFHSEDETDQKLRKAKSKIGGLNKRRYEDKPSTDISGMPLDTPDDCASVLQLVIKDSYAGFMSPSKASALTSAVKLLLDAIDRTSTMRRLEALEARYDGHQ